MDANDTQGFMEWLNTLLGQFSRQGGQSIGFMLVAVACNLLVGLYIFYIYKRTYIGAMYSRSFNVSLVLLTVVTMLAILVIGINPMLSLGMIGAVSIVRMRTAVKEPMDAVFILWAAISGIIFGWAAATGIQAKQDFLMVGLAGSAAIGAAIYILTIPRGRPEFPYMLIIRHDNISEGEVNYAMHRLPGGARLKSRTVTRNGVEIIMHLHLPEENESIVNHFRRIRGVFDANLIKVQDEYKQQQP
jgi:hypothetical protein